MMGRQADDQSLLFCHFKFEGHISANHLYRRFNSAVTREPADLREDLAPF
jgi:hypothetical protein